MKFYTLLVDDEGNPVDGAEPTAFDTLEEAQEDARQALEDDGHDDVIVLKAVLKGKRSGVTFDAVTD